MASNQYNQREDDEMQSVQELERSPRSHRERRQSREALNDKGDTAPSSAPVVPPPPSYAALFGETKPSPPPIPPLPLEYLLKQKDDIRDADADSESSEPPPVPPRPSEEAISGTPEPQYESEGDLSETTLSSSRGSAPQAWKRRPLSLEEEEIIDNWRAPASVENVTSSSLSSESSQTSPFIRHPGTEMTTLEPAAHYTDIDNGTHAAALAPSLYEETSFSVPIKEGDIKFEIEEAHKEEVYSTPENIEPEIIQPSRNGDVEAQMEKERPMIFWVIVIAIVSVIVIGVVLILVLVPMTFAYLDYYRVGLKEQRSTGEVDESKTYLSGRHGIGPDYKFRKFYSTAYVESLDDLAIFSVERLEIIMHCTFQYFLKEDELGDLFEKYDNDFEAVIYKVAYSTIKNAATKFSIDEYIKERRKVEEGLHKALRLKLGGNCCPADPEGCIDLNICDVCSRASDCNKGYHIDVRYFQFGKVVFPERLLERFMTQQMLFLYVEKEQFFQEYAVTQKQTEALKEEILNEVREITANATAEADMIRAKVEADAMAVVETAHMNGLLALYQSIGANTEEHKASVNFLFTLDKHPNLYMGVGYEKYLHSVHLNP